MGSYQVTGGQRITGEFAVRGSKNAALPILAASLLAEDTVVLERLPQIRDVEQTLEILEELGCRVERGEHRAVIDSRSLQKTEISSHTVRQMRSSILFLGALLGRMGEGRLASPGGCAIGKRPIDLHLAAFAEMGVEIKQEGEQLDCRCAEITGRQIWLDFPSVGATENILLLAVKARGVTELHNAAKEPEVSALVRFLRGMGAEIYGEGTETLLIHGAERLHGTRFSIPADRIEGGTFLCAAAITGGELLLEGVERWQLGAVQETLEKMGCQMLWETRKRLWMHPPCRLLSDIVIRTSPFPDFPTDLQPLFMSLLTLAKGNCMMIETVFEARFSQGKELCRMGADIRIDGQKAWIRGVERLHGAEVFAQDLRCGAALVVAALAAEGESLIHGSEYVERGYERIEDALLSLGGRIRRIEEREKNVKKTEEAAESKKGNAGYRFDGGIGIL